MTTKEEMKKESLSFWLGKLKEALDEKNLHLASLIYEELVDINKN